jgi:hypothetical protein
VQVEGRFLEDRLAAEAAALSRSGPLPGRPAVLAAKLADLAADHVGDHAVAGDLGDGPGRDVLPSRITVTRSASSKISSSRWLM